MDAVQCGAVDGRYWWALGVLQAADWRAVSSDVTAMSTRVKVLSVLGLAGKVRASLLPAD